jgi:hypothetical protein
MIGADAALAALINQAAYQHANAVPPFVTFTERMHVAAAGRAKDINRFEAVRVADGYAVMHDLPNGGTNTDYAFPITPFFDPFCIFSWGYTVNFSKIYVQVVPGQTFAFAVPTDSSVDAVVPYFPYWYPHYAPDSTDDSPHILIDRTTLWPADAFYVSDVREDPATHLPSAVTMTQDSTGTTVGLAFGTVDNYWVITKATFTKTQHIFIGTITGTAEMDYTDFAFPPAAPDPLLSGTPRPAPTLQPASAASPSAAASPTAAAAPTSSP